MATAYFITGTDTDAGKTWVTCALMQAAAAQGITSVGYKPVSAGCEQTPQGLRNSDALSLQRHCQPELAYDAVNPIAFADPVAPHLAARRQGVTIDMPTLVDGLDALCALQTDIVWVEGAGGWRLPLSGNGYLSDLAIARQLPVIMVVGMKLGCLNHAVLTAEAIRQDGLTLAGWIANDVDPTMLYHQDNIDTLHELLPAPCLGHVPHVSSTAEAASYLNDLDWLRA
ncbi:dethiobiotin synthase [Aestuariibacter halophilus]|uniref:ATP-dependent dethiobiotin synthetase BioD n=1 Tax=Fluctibacter halophilus TaxID=226011 RepID=A0ABS8G655_9ALTE|nr:dethiobiotin synthase [Aestuariibacter halophilus]MCC2616077.1 dethiobiotin synthase [Aestuariibacter halophilus]